MIRKFLVTVFATVALAGAFSFPAYADDAGRSNHYHEKVNSHYSWLFRMFWAWTRHIHDGDCGHGTNIEKHLAKLEKPGHDSKPGNKPANKPSNKQVPELDGSAAAISLLLLGGLIALRRETRSAG